MRTEHVIHMPSGYSFALDGRFFRVNLPTGGVTPAIERSDKVIVIVDPRAYVISASENEYDPRANTEIPQWAREWLASNPNWILKIT